MYACPKEKIDTRQFIDDILRYHPQSELFDPDDFMDNITDETVLAYFNFFNPSFNILVKKRSNKIPVSEAIKRPNDSILVQRFYAESRAYEEEMEPLKKRQAELECIQEEMKKAVSHDFLPCFSTSQCHPRRKKV